MAKPMYPSEKLDQYMLRFPDGMRERLKTLAKDNNRTLNAEIIARLEASLDAPVVLTQGPGILDEEIARLRKRVHEVNALTERLLKLGRGFDSNEELKSILAIEDEAESFRQFEEYRKKMGVKAADDDK